jgi:hypothetical protein
MRVVARLRRAKARLLDHAIRAHDASRTRGGWLGRLLARGIAASIRALPEHEVVSLRWLHDRVPDQVLRPAQQGLAAGPRVGTHQTTVTVPIPSVNTYEFEDAVVRGGSSSVLLASELVVEGIHGIGGDRGNFVAGHLVAHGTESAVVRRRRTTAIPAGIFLGGNGAFNYYHWMVELLPKLEFLPYIGRLAERMPLLVADEAASVPTIRAGLDELRGGRPVVVLERNTSYTVGRLIYVNAPSVCPFNLRPNQRLEVSDFRLRPESIQFVRRGLHPLPTARPIGEARIFLARGRHRRNYNQEELIAAAVERGFVPVHLEAMSLPEQIATIQSAASIVGPSGAAWTNLIFARAGARCLSWLPDGAKEFAAYSTIAQLVGVDLRFLTYRTGTTSTGQLYRQDYRLDAEAFARELDALLLEVADHSAGSTKDFAGGRLA